MLYRNQFAMSLALVVVFVLGSDSFAVNYRVTFDATWSAVNHPDAYPGRSAHFSTPIGTTHNETTVLWLPGQLATPGLEGVAESGSIRVMQNEITAMIDAGNALGFIQGSTFNSPGTIATEFEIVADFSKVSLVSMIAPSPDWFVGVHGLELRDESGWIPKMVVSLAPYDAGTEDGIGFNTNNPASNPLETIRRLDTDVSSVLFEAQSFGTFTFELLPICDINFDDRCNTADLNSVDGLYSAGDLTQGIAVELGVNSKFDLNTDGVVDIADLDVWLADAADHNGFADPYFRGDTNLNDHVGFGDFIALARGFGTGREWTDGNYDGSGANTSFTDFLALSQNFGKRISRKPSPIGVPEPSGNCLLLMGCVVVVASRRHNTRVSPPTGRP